MQTAGHLVSPSAEFSSRMENCKHYLHGGNTRLMINTYGNPSAIIRHSDRIVFIYGYINRITETCKGLIHGIINNLIHQMM